MVPLPLSPYGSSTSLSLWFLYLSLSICLPLPTTSSGLSPCAPGAASVWAITPEERGKHDKQFDSLAPALGHVSGEQARKFFLQSGLPPPVLAEIWALADLDCDGKMDRLEFSIAMKLIKLKLQGRGLPTSLPIVMKQSPAANPASIMTSSSRFGMGSMPNLSLLVPSMPSMSILTPVPVHHLPLMHHPVPGQRPMMHTPMTLPLMSSLGNAGLPNGHAHLLTPSPVPSNTGWYCKPIGSDAANSLLDLGSSSSNSSSTNSLASNSPKTVTCDWAVPQAARLKYRQQFNTLDKLMSGYLSGPQVRNALLASNLTQTQLAAIWTLADVDRDGQLRADEFILAMHLVDMAKTGHPLPLSLPQDLVPPSLSAELEKRRLALEEERRRERERRDREQREAQERREREAREQENRRRLEEERRLERQREMERQREEERLRELERKEELERQRKEAWERGRREELSRRKEGDQEEIVQLKARKKCLEIELEAGSKHKQISDRLRDAQSKRRIQKSELDLINQKRDVRIAEINTLQVQFEVREPAADPLVRALNPEPSSREPEGALMSPTVPLLPPAAVTLATLGDSVTEKGVTCRRLKDQLDTLERETADKLGQMEQYNKELKEEREAQARLRAAQEKAQEEERRRREHEEEEEKRRQKEEEEERRRREKEEKEAKEEQERRRKEEEQERRREVEAAEEEKRRKEEERMQKEEERRRREQQQKEAGGGGASVAVMTLYRALYPFVARNADELSLEGSCLIEVDEATVGEPGWLCGSYRGNRGWFPQSYAERCAASSASSTTTNTSSEAAPPASQHGAPLRARAVTSWSSSSSDAQPDPSTRGGGGGDSITALLSFSQGDVISVLQQREDWWLGQLAGTQGWFPKDYVTLEPDNTDPEAGDLTFDEGDVVMVTEREGEWWRGCIGDRAGVFPSNYVRPVEPEVESSTSTHSYKYPPSTEIAQALVNTVAPTAQQLSLSPGQLIVVLAKNSTGWWLGELQARGKKRQRGWFHSSNVKLLGPTSGKSTPSPLPVCQVITMYDYTAANQDELSFSKGQLISVLDKTNPDWWKGEVNGVTGLLPTNYVKMTTESDPSQQWCADLMSLDSMTPQERKRQGYIHELIQTEETYVEDLELVLEVFHKPMSESGRLTPTEMGTIFVNWRELIMCNTKLLKALRVRKKTGGENMAVQVIGDLLAAELAHMQPYIRFCSCQLNAAALLQRRTNSEPDFKDFLKKIATNYRCKGMPLSSFLLKPMQRITRYPLLIKNILENTPEGHVDRGSLREALERAEELCSQVNEGVREKENSDRLEWIQSHVQCDGLIEHLVFNSLTNCLGPRKLLHSGRLHKTRGGRELWVFLFNDFLLLTHSPAKSFSSSSSSSLGADRLFSHKANVQLKMYKTPLFLNEVLVKNPPDPSSDEPLFHISHIDRVYTLKADTLNERTTWVQRIKAASEVFIETEKKKREKAYQARSLKTSGIGRLLVTVTEAQELKACKPNGKSNPYCELTMGAQCYTSRPLGDTLNPKWNFNCQFFVRDFYQDVLCITVFEKDQFSPDDFLGRTEVPVATIKKEMESKGAATRRLLLHEVPTGEVLVKLDLQLYEQTA
uniref:Intersectin 2a n=1 Tax=Gadus morhua TaxID=8049 RepID=A0A8C5A9Q4_GADMO